jgi:LuxR family transcriptional regulator
MPDEDGLTVRRSDGADRAIDRPLFLSRRQRQCLTLAGQGDRDREIAGALGISLATVRNHLVAARRRLKARNTAQAVAMAVQQNLISVDISNQEDLHETQ